MLTQEKYGAMKENNRIIFSKVIHFFQNGKHTLPYGITIALQDWPDGRVGAFPFLKMPNRLDPLPVRAA